MHILSSPNQPLNRRDFIMTTTTAALAVGALNLADKAFAAAGPARWIVGCRDVHLKFVDKTDSWAALRQLNADCCEADVDDALALPSLLVPGKKYSVAAADGIAALKADLQANNRRIGAFCLHNRFDERLEKEVELCTRLASAAEQLNVPAIRIDVVPRALKMEEFAPFAIKACKQVCEATSDTNIRFAIENHGRATNDPDLMEQILSGVGSDRLGITLDTANLYWFGHPLEEIYKIYERFAPRVYHTHCKSIAFPEDKRNIKRQIGWEYDKRCCPIYEGDLDFKRITAILRKAGYTGDLCVEDESLGRFPETERAAILQKEIAFLRKVA